MKTSTAPVTLVVPGDLHLTSRDQPNFEVATRLLREVDEFIRPDFIQFIGDNVQDATDDQFRLFDELRGSLSVPHYVLVGDHDVVHDPEAVAFRKWIGDPRGSLLLRGFRFLRMNTLEIPRLGFSEAQLDWLSVELELARQQHERVVLFQHHYPYKVCEQFAGPGIDRWRELVSAYRPTAMICGHTHYGQTANDGRNLAVTVRSIGDPEGGAPGYLMVHLENDDFALSYRTIDDSGPLLLITHPRDMSFAIDERHIVHGHDEVRIRIWSTISVTTVAGTIDDGACFDLLPSNETTWIGPISGSELRKGEHVVKVVAQLSDGQQCHNQLSFFVDTTGRFTAVPNASPVVRTTAFC